MIIVFCIAVGILERKLLGCTKGFNIGNRSVIIRTVIEEITSGHIYFLSPFITVV